MSEGRRGWIWKMLIEVFLIGVAVFLGMAADQWRTNRQHRDAARAALHRIKAEIEANQAEVQRVLDYHALLREALIGYFDPKTRAATTLQITEGVNPAKFQHTAWDLAVATQALADIDQATAQELAGVYGVQDSYNELSRGLTQAMYLRPPGENRDAFLQSLKIYYDDIVGFEPALLAMYEKVLPRITAALRD